jgi:hypothetical protein
MIVSEDMIQNGRAVQYRYRRRRPNVLSPCERATTAASSVTLTR